MNVSKDNGQKTTKELKYSIIEVSAGIYEIEAVNIFGISYSNSGTDPEKLIVEMMKYFEPEQRGRFP
jgi:hypothetical protein